MHAGKPQPAQALRGLSGEGPFGPCLLGCLLPIAAILLDPVAIGGVDLRPGECFTGVIVAGKVGQQIGQQQ